MSSEDLVVLIRDLKLVATVWTSGKALFDLSFEVSLAPMPFEELLFGLLMLHLEFTQKKTHY